MDLSYDEIGDAGILELVTEIDNQNPGLEELNLAGNDIGKNYTYFSKYVETFIHYLVSASRLQTFSLASNNLRGSVNDVVERLLLCFQEMASLKKVDLSNNALGQSYGTYPFNPRFQGKTPPVCVLGDVLINSTIREISIANNLMEEQSALSIAHGLKHTSTLKSIDISGNPIGPHGMRLLMQSMSFNTIAQFSINMKDIAAEVELKSKKELFDPNNPEGKHSLDLSQSHNQIVLQNLLAAAERSVAENEGKFEIKQCFVKVTFNGKSKWDPPLEKNSQGLFQLGEAPSGVLAFDFCLNPALLKETEKQIRKLTEAGNLKEAEQLIENQSKPPEVITLNSIQKHTPTESSAESFYDMIVDRYQEGDEQNMLHMITNMTREHSLWFSQAHEALYVCKFQEQAAMVGPHLLGSVYDSHLRFALCAQACQHGEDMMNQLLTSIKSKMGPNAMYWSCFNPNGRYRLDLGNPAQRDVAKNLIAINKRNNAKIVAKEQFDRSQNGNQSCFRNERMNNLKFVMHVPSWRLPESGIFEFDFQCFDQQPTADQISDKDDILLLLEWFESANEQL